MNCERASRAAYVQLVLGTVLLSTGATVIKATTLGALELAGWRALVIASFLALAVRPRLTAFDNSLLPAIATHVATTLLLMWANKLASAATAVFLQYTAPVYVLLLSPLVLGESVRPRDLAYVAVLLCGMALLIAQPGDATHTAPNPALGAIVAAGAGCCWGLSTLAMRGLARRADGFERTIAAVIVANTALAATLLPALGWPARAGVTDAGWVVYMGVVQLGTAFLLISRAMQRLSALESAFLLLVEPVLSPVWVWFVHGEVPGATSLAGGALILTATAWRARRG
jgi:drug/metabolite transporter (DMT)-like permease